MVVFLQNLKSRFDRVRKATLRARLRLSQTFLRTSYWLRMQRRRRAGIIELCCWLIAIGLGVFSKQPIQYVLDVHFETQDFDAIRTLFGTIGGAMIGATAITASFILFALQVNVERLPHELFHHFSSDRPLIAAVATSLILAIAGTALSLAKDDSLIATALLLGILALALILRLLFYGYRRSLVLISPRGQLDAIHAALIRELKRWGRQVDALTTFIELPPEAQGRERLENRLDIARAAVLQSNPNWAREVKSAVGQAAAYARRAGEAGDLEVSDYALKTLVAMNERYVVAKGRTFFANQLMLDSPHVTDGVINETLEHLKRLRNVALTRRDELHIEQIFSTLVALVHLYTQIEYPYAHDNKSHAILAAGYLETSVEAVITADLTDTAMQGVRAMGNAATAFLAAGHPVDAVTLIRRIAAFACLGALNPEQKAVTLVGMEQLRDLTLNLFRVDGEDPRFALRQMRQSVSQLVQTFLRIPDAPALMIGHSNYLAPYYSMTSADGFAQKMGHLANTLAECEAGDATAARIIDHIEDWADQIYDTHKAILLLTTASGSPFFFDISHWISHISRVLLALSAAPATRDHARDELRNHAHWLISTFDWIPTDVDTVKFVEGWSYLENLIGFALFARSHDEIECYNSVERIVLKWALQAGAHNTGWSTLSGWTTALVALAVTSADDADGARLKVKFTAMLAEAKALPQDMRDRAAFELREAAQEVRYREKDVNRVRALLARGNSAVVRQLLTEIAAILSPGTINEPVRSFRFGAG